jgi:thioredoxin reductase (NADPH)
MADVTVYGAPWCPDCRRSKRFLAEQRVAYEWVDIDQEPQGLRRVEELQKGGRTIPTIVFGDGTHLVDPSNEDLARRLGLTLEARRSFYDLAIVGGGPAGLAAAIYAAREGIDSIVLDRGGLGGQAGVTERIDNYPGFPDGVGGAELADRFIAQARRYGVELLAAVGVDGMDRDGDDLCLALGTGGHVGAHTVLLAPGSTYRRLGVAGEDKLIGAGVHFCATCDGPFYRGSEELLVVGGGNSAGEEAAFLTKFAQRVHVVQRGPELTASPVVVDRLNNDPRFVVHLNSEVVALHGDGKLDDVVIRDVGSGAETTLHPSAAFIFIGLDPNTEFLRGVVDLDERGFVRTDGCFKTSKAGVFAAGDARHGSTKQLGAAVGDGIAALISIRDYLRKHHHLMAPEPMEDLMATVAR